MRLAMLWVLIGFATAANQAALPGCPDKCGDVEIPYPFGLGNQHRSNTGEKCFLDKGFNLTCDQASRLWTTQSHNSQTQNSQSQISAIDILQGDMEILMPISRLCLNETGMVIHDENPWLGVPNSFTVSSKANKFITVGCNSYGYLNGFKNEKNFSAACISLCNGAPDKQQDAENCSGFGCCRVDIPAVGMRDFQVDAYSFAFKQKVWEFNNCSYSFVAKNGWYNFSGDDLENLRFDSTPLIIDWAVGNENQTCQSALTTSKDYVCSINNTECVDTETGSGYRYRSLSAMLFML